jgi:hypothetical protein
MELEVGLGMGGAPGAYFGVSVHAFAEVGELMLHGVLFLLLISDLPADDYNW